jgi:hypothetical protein
MYNAFIVVSSLRYPAISCLGMLSLNDFLSAQASRISYPWWSTDRNADRRTKTYAYIWKWVYQMHCRQVYSFIINKMKKSSVTSITVCQGTWTKMMVKDLKGTSFPYNNVMNVVPMMTSLCQLSSRRHGLANCLFKDATRNDLLTSYLACWNSAPLLTQDVME